MPSVKRQSSGVNFFLGSMKFEKIPQPVTEEESSEEDIF